MKNEQIGIFVNTPFTEYLVGSCESIMQDEQEEKVIFFIKTKDFEYYKSLKDVKSLMIKKFDLTDFKSTYKEELNAVNLYNKNKKIALSHLQILQITYNLSTIGDTSDAVITEQYEKLNLYYKSIKK